ncbi:hypothetical protein [Nonomuraea aurantiaca]|uniref:hypothetical protein n=1 Tax=Nonomuraea aurantiaca TaxID=2878562 RepID=UPI001CD9F605|nr:hypothetical protein [Nonomuraea aurantiaca]MCA2225408.1 hypothetical protein [Nonomuraea aurantiaca]
MQAALERARQEAERARQEAERVMQLEESEEDSEESSDSVFQKRPSKRKISGSSGGSVKKKQK